ncbi:TetR/AcrR family transcriptional regulator [Vallicoccus soli]|uniref:TetR/AcrR family transcriptional regulator n=1 Tax=Vallicoccus soli TaxID=2339232 RepID=UPI001403B174|nr:TetR/AcrR family transcriptional regulator [Vallicoccus soli]
MTEGTAATAGTGAAAPTGAPAPGLRERKKRGTRAALAAAVLELAAERGLDAVTVEEVAARADVSYRTFFNHFGSKEEALVFPVGRVPGEVRAALLAEDPALPAWEACRRVLRVRLAALEAERDDWLVRLDVIAATPSLLPRLVAAGTAEEQELAAALAERAGAPPEDARPRLLAAVASATARHALVEWQRGGGAAPLAGLVDEAFAAVATATGP